MTNALEEQPHPRHAVTSPARPRLRLHVSATALERSSTELADARTRREAGRALGLSALLRRRPELEGVHAPADLADEFLRWCL